MYTFKTDCVSAKGRDIIAMMDSALEVTYETIRKHIADFADVCKMFGYAVGNEAGLHMRNDWHVRYYRSKYCGEKCYVIQHSGIEYVFTKG